ncbi:capsule biosynthesis protein [Anaerobiospirillum thomasii]|uniref:capsule biosynthesis protein n=1 Tax=Anaerobiospirillum thomasii TaxID=179995 RepID=UPI001559AB71|nr:capsule biosynthesis protein [Anaerobiospirillum thomasii]
MYISEAKFAVRTISPTTGGIDFASQIFNVPSTSMQEAKIVEDYLKSPDVVHVINQELDVLKHYTSSSYDWFSRLTSNPTSDDVITFWKKISLVKVNNDSSVISLSVRAYTPEMAHSIVSNALMQCEKLINSMNERARHDALLLAQNEVDVAKNKFDQAQNALKEFRNQHQDLDLKTTATGLQSLIIELEGQATSIRTQIAEALAYMQEDAPSIKALRSKLSGVEQQLEREREKVTSLSTQGQSINTLAGLYESLTIDVEFARKQLEFAMTSLEKAKIEVMSQNLYVVNIAKPSLPDESLYPKPLLYTFYLLIALNLMWAIISVIIVAIKEHLGLV